MFSLRALPLTLALVSGASGQDAPTTEKPDQGRTTSATARPTPKAVTEPPTVQLPAVPWEHFLDTGLVALRRLQRPPDDVLAAFKSDSGKAWLVSTLEQKPRLVEVPAWLERAALLRLTSDAPPSNIIVAERKNLEAMMSYADASLGDPQKKPADRIIDLVEFNIRVSQIAFVLPFLSNESNTLLEEYFLRTAKRIDELPRQIVVAYIDAAVARSSTKGSLEMNERRFLAPKKTMSIPFGLPIESIPEPLYLDLKRSSEVRPFGREWRFRELSSTDCDPSSAQSTSRDWSLEFTSTHLRMRADQIDLVTLRNTMEEGMLVTIPIEKFRAHLENKTLGELTTAAREMRKLERAGEPALRALDLPRGTQLIQVFPRDGDFFTTGNLVSALFLARALRERCGTTIDDSALHFTNDARGTLQKEITDRYARGSRNFFLDLYSHGLENSLFYRTPFDARGLADLCRAFPEAHFFVHTPACYGGGLREGLKKEFESDPNLKHRITLILHTKPEVPNYLADIPSNSHTTYPFGGTHLVLHLLQALYDPKTKTIGEALLRAEEAVRRYRTTDAEILLDGILIGYADPLGRNAKYPTLIAGEFGQ